MWQVVFQMLEGEQEKQGPCCDFNVILILECNVCHLILLRYLSMCGISFGKLMFLMSCL